MRRRRGPTPTVQAPPEDDPNFCKGCFRELTFARHAKTGKVAPLVIPKNGMAPNIRIVKCGNDMPIYFIEKGPDTTHINHFADCQLADMFRSQEKK